MERENFGEFLRSEMLRLKETYIGPWTESLLSKSESEGKFYKFNGNKIYPDYLGDCAYIACPTKVGYWELFNICYWADDNFVVRRIGHWVPEKKKVLIDEEDITETTKGREIVSIFKNADDAYSFRRENSLTPRKT